MANMAVKILHVISSVDPTGGEFIEAIKQISKSLVSQGHTTEVACLDAPTAPWLKTFPFPVYALGSGKPGYKYSKLFVPWLRQNATKYDCIIVHGIWQYSSFATWLALKSLYQQGCNHPLLCLYSRNA